MTGNRKTKGVLVTKNVYRKGHGIFEAITNAKVVVAPENAAELSALIRKQNPAAVVIGMEKYNGPLSTPGLLCADLTTSND